MTVLQSLRGFCARAYGAEQQARHPFINPGIVIGHSKSQDKAVRSAAAQNLIGRLKEGKLGADLVIELLAHLAAPVKAAAADCVIKKGITVPDQKAPDFIAAFLATDLKEHAAKMALETFPAHAHVLMVSDDDPALAAKARDALVKRIFARSLKPQIELFLLDYKVVCELLSLPAFRPEERVYVLEGAIRVDYHFVQGWENTGYYMFQPGATQTTYMIDDQRTAANLLKAAFGATSDSLKPVFLENLKASKKLGRFVYYNDKTKGWDCWQFTAETIKIGKDLSQDALGPKNPFKSESRYI